MDTTNVTTEHEDDEIAGLDTPDWRSRNADLRARYLHAITARDQAIASADTIKVADAERTLENLGREFYELNQGLALASARRFSTGAGSLADYQAAAALGLWEAFTRWDPERGVAFSTFSRQYVNGRIQRAVRQVEFSQLSQSEFSLRKHIRAAANAIATTEQRAATIEELAQAVGERPERVLRTMSAPAASLETPLGDGAGTLGDLVADEPPILDDHEGVDDLGALLDPLPDLEAWILAVRSGAYGGDTPSLLDVAGQLGIGREIARRAETRGRLRLIHDKLTERNGEPPAPGDLAEAIGKDTRHVRKYLVDPDLAELRRRWQRATDALSFAGSRVDQSHARATLAEVGQQVLTRLADQAADASVRYSDTDGNRVSTDEAACALFHAFVTWNTDESTWAEQARQGLDAIGTRRRRSGVAEPLDQGNTWTWLKNRYVNA